MEEEFQAYDEHDPIFILQCHKQREERRIRQGIKVALRRQQQRRIREGLKVVLRRKLKKSVIAAFVVRPDMIGGVV